MDQGRIVELLQPFLADSHLPQPAHLSSVQLESISTYIELLLRWNARVNLTAVRDPDQIVTRHFGESFFLAAYLFPPGGQVSSPNSPERALDLGSGAGFPGLPLKIYVPELPATLAESNHKKAAFLSEVIRALRLENISVYSGRIQPSATSAADWPLGQAPGLVTMRAVEHFPSALATAGALARAGAKVGGAGKLALLIGETQAQGVPGLVPDFGWDAPIPVPHSRERVLLIGKCSSPKVPT
ncbi:MAG TPA: 16S rRNA (guanine(527)-N(7))-methyltransferase RsmG [Terriglobales bacterium]|nr:16S rRNA (guanine(527)-N(7))-methyltransferase RsmG [Terriglobales bacterium]